VLARTAKPKAAAAARIGAALARRKRAELLDLLRPCFARTGPWLQAGKYAAAVMSQIPRRNGRTIAAQAGDRPPDRTQRLLSRAARDTVAAMAVVRRFAVAGARLGTASPRHHLLIRRHLAAGELAFCYCHLPDGQPASPSRPVRAAGLRWPY